MIKTNYILHNQKETELESINALDFACLWNIFRYQIKSYKIKTEIVKTSNLGQT